MGSVSDNYEVRMSENEHFGNIDENDIF